ncbi:MAG: hypothetical protein A2284_19175 [Deltaproteobacteria bacterium RIFOXYA12_FULL_61_11]|nr:MAG: hypothetical protein A2284_19175 [Deltaproteobacteria bacterium RIFOXYA12_FULL_61_11]
MRMPLFLLALLLLSFSSKVQAAEEDPATACLAFLNDHKELRGMPDPELTCARVGTTVGLACLQTVLPHAKHWREEHTIADVVEGCAGLRSLEGVVYLDRLSDQGGLTYEDLLEAKAIEGYFSDTKLATELIEKLSSYSEFRSVHDQLKQKGIYRASAIASNLAGVVAILGFACVFAQPTCAALVGAIVGQAVATHTVGTVGLLTFVGAFSGSGFLKIPQSCLDEKDGIPVGEERLSMDEINRRMAGLSEVVVDFFTQAFKTRGHQHLFSNYGDFAFVTFKHCRRVKSLFYIDKIVFADKKHYVGTVTSRGKLGFGLFEIKTKLDIPRLPYLNIDFMAPNMAADPMNEDMEYVVEGRRQKPAMFTIRHTQRQFLVLNSRLLEEID